MSNPSNMRATHPAQTRKKLSRVSPAPFFFAAVIQALVSCGQWRVAQRALWDAQTPHVQLWAEGGELTLSGKLTPITAHIRNAGNVTLFNGKVWTRIALVPVDRPEAVWNSLEFQDTIVMGPDDIEDYPTTAYQLTPSQFERIENGASMIMVGVKIEYPDSAERLHHRYICYRWKREGMDRSARVCPTPPQD